MTGNTLRTWVKIDFDPSSVRWMDNAACKGENTLDFFAYARGADNAARAATERARSICERCTVTDECRRYAIQIEADGIWGGETYVERRESRRAEAAV